MSTEGYRYVLGSVLNQVLLHQSIIGLESKIAMEKLEEYPDVVIGCAGGGSNLGGLIAPFMQDKLLGKADPRIIAVEPASCPSFTRGKYAYDFCDTGKITPLAKMYTLGSGFIPSSNHAGGLRYHGMSPILSKLYHDGYMEAVSVEQTRVFEAAVEFAKKETILPAPESAHAIRAAMDEALRCKETGEKKTILFGLTGTGYFDMTAYSAYLEGRMTDYIPTDEDLQRGFNGLPKIPESRNKLKEGQLLLRLPVSCRFRDCWTKPPLEKEIPFPRGGFHKRGKVDLSIESLCAFWRFSRKTQSEEGK